MNVHAHRYIRKLTIDSRIFILTLEISGRTGGIYEGKVREGGKVLNTPSDVTATNSDGPKKSMVRWLYQNCGKTPDESIALDDWTYEELNLDGTLAVATQ